MIVIDIVAVARFIKGRDFGCFPPLGKHADPRETFMSLMTDGAITGAAIFNIHTLILSTPMALLDFKRKKLFITNPFFTGRIQNLIAGSFLESTKFSSLQMSKGTCGNNALSLSAMDAK